MKNITKIRSLVLAFAILLSALPMNTQAAGDNIGSVIQSVYREAKKSDSVDGRSLVQGWRHVS